MLGGAALGNGKVADPTKSDTNDPSANGSQQLVTGGTVYTALQNQKTDLTKDLSVNAGWGINIADEKDENNNVTKKNVISLNRNLGTNYGNKYKGKGKVTFEADGENSLILGGGAGNNDPYETDNDVTYGAHAKDSILLGGWNNDIAKESERALIIGGTWNTTSSTGEVQKTGTDAIIVGGFHNKAEGDGAVLIGGETNEATGYYSTITGGSGNKNNGWESSIVGGVDNEITTYGQGNSIFGGGGNKITYGAGASILGGYKNTANMKYATVVGGGKNTSSGVMSSVFGGANNFSNANASTVIGGQLNTAVGAGSVVSGGAINLASGDYSYAAGGLYNNVTGAEASSLGGQYSSVNGTFSTGVAGGSTGQDAMFSLAAGYQSVVADSGIEKTDLSSDNPEDADEINKFVEAYEAEDKSKIESLSGYYKIDPDSGFGYIKLTHYDKFSTALGYQATADEPGTIAFGHDAGDESGYTYEWETLTDEKGNPKQNDIDGTTNDYTKAPKSVKKKDPYTSAYYNRLVKVADGIEDHDVVVMEQLKQYAEKDASNIGNYLTVDPVYQKDDQGNVKLGTDNKPLVDEKATETKLAESQTANKDAWGQALGAGTLSTADAAKNSDQLITGKTLYNYDAPVAETGKTLTYVSANNTTGQNLSALDAQVKANTDTLSDKTHNIKYYSVDDKAPTFGLDTYSNAGNDGAQGSGSLSAGFLTHADGIASTVAGSYSGVINSPNNGRLDFRGAAALSYGTFNVNQNTDVEKYYSGVANSIVGQANMAKDSNAAIIYGAGNTVTNSYRAIDDKKINSIFSSLNDPEALSKALQDAVPTSGGQVMVMGGGNSVDNAYMTQVTGVGNTVTGSGDAYSADSSQLNYVEGFYTTLTNGKSDYIIGAHNTVTGDTTAQNQSNIVFGDNHTLTNTKNAVIIGSSDTQMNLDKGDNATAIGHNASAQRDALAVGVNTEARGNAVALGTSSTAHNNSIAIGTRATAVSSQNLAIGWEAHIGNIKTDDEKIKNAIALGSDSQVRVNDLLESDNNRGVLSIGDTKKERRIIHVRAGVNDTDAVNVAQLKSLQSGLTEDLTDKGLKFAANSGTEYTAKLGSTVKIQGTKKKDGHEYTADNLTTEVDGSGNITILMDKNISADKIAVNGKDGKDAVSIAGKDGVGHIGLTGPAGTNGKDGTSIDISVKNGYDVAGADGKDGINGAAGVDGTSLTRVVYEDKNGEHQIATLDDGLKFKGDDGKEIAKKLNNTLEIIGGADSTKLTEKNIGVNKTDDGKLKIQLAQELNGITSIGNQKTENGKTTGGKITFGTDSSVNVNGGKITNVGNGVEKDGTGKYTVTEQNKTNGANIGDVQNIVNDAKKELTDGENGLNSKANVNASNIGTNLDADKQQDNLNKWGQAIGTGKVEANNGQLVTGKTVYDEVRPEDGNYVKKNQTTGQNLSVLDDQVKKNADAIKTNSDAIKKNADNIQNITNNVNTLSDNAVQYDKDSNKTKVTLKGDGGTTIDNVKDGTLSETSKEAVNGKQLWQEQQDRKNMKDISDTGKTVIRDLAKGSVKVVDGKNTTVTEGTEGDAKTYAVNVEGKGTVASGDTGLISGGTLYNEVHVDKDGSYIKSGNTVGKNLSALDTGLKNTSSLIHTNTSGDTIHIGETSKATKVDVSSTDANGNKNGRVVTGVVTDAKDANSAANVGYVNGVTAANTQQIYRDMNSAYGRLNNNINKAAAGSNALAALHPLDYDPDEKADFAVGYGHYRNANAAAVGAFYHPNENTMVNVGVSLGNGDPGFNAGVSFKIGSGSSGHQAMSKTEMAKVINSQSKEIDALKKDNEDKDKRINALEQKMAEVLAKLDKNGK